MLYLNRSRCYVRQFFLRQFFHFSSTIQEQVVFRPCFRTCHWSKSELIEVKCCPVELRLILTSTFGLGQVRLGQVRLGKVRLGQVRLGQVRLGQVRLGQVRLGQGRLGQVRAGQDRLGYELFFLKNKTFQSSKSITFELSKKVKSKVTPAPVKQSQIYLNAFFQCKIICCLLVSFPI